MVTFESSSRSPFVPYALDLATSFLGVGFDVVSPADRAPHVDIYHGNDERRPCSIRIPLVDRYTLAEVPRAPRRTRHRRDAPGAGAFPFDLFAAIRFWLADEGNANMDAESFDEHSRLRWRHSAHERAQVREIPIVNAYLLLFRDWLEQRLGARTSSTLPAGARCVIVLSHDVDRPIDPGSPGHTLRRAVRALTDDGRRVAALVYGSIALAEALAARAQRPPPRHWLFAELADAEERYGFQSTFFMAPTSRFDTEGRRLDVAYDVSAPEFRSLFPMLLRRGFEIGLHVGYGAGSDAVQIRREKERLEASIGTDVLGGRHHYWHTGHPFWDTLDAHAAAGLRYDSSLAFNDAAGYRLGIAFPFQPWHPVHERPVPALQIPPMAMDGAFFYGKGRREDEAVARIARLVDDLKQYEGFASVDWHQETSVPASREFRPWGRAYLAILDLLASDPEVAIRSFSEVVTMNSARRQARDAEGVRGVSR